MNDKKAVIFDGDGTLWRPKGQNKTMRPDSIYKGDRVEKNSHLNLCLVPGVLKILKELRLRGYRAFVVSAHPTPGPGALLELESKILSLGIKSFVDEYFCSDGGNKDGKTQILENITCLMESLK